MHYLVIWVFCIFGFQVTAQEKLTHIYLAGDSTVQDVDPARGPDFGWGQLLPTLLAKKSHAVIENHAKGGRSTKTFIRENRWQTIVDKLQQNDWVLIQFGHNDASYHKLERYTAPVDYKLNLLKFVHDVKAKNALPVLITPVMRRYFDNEGKLKDVHGIYPSLVREVALETNTPLIDLMKSSGKLLLKYGVEGSKTLYMSVGPGEHPRYPDGKEDSTHFSKKGALEMAKLVVYEAQLKSIQPLADFFKTVNPSL
ncbi:rhamnogalacturonan acetylesterase [Catenovulum sediminis]|uniref:Rhamnogalacturonan acetylesterase n=1 Tax=Catenovulum sediminis TaxID=1740262 RepID=A0ABV1RKI8_9ALTE|nr:rhamnogalacturonan acetylesterase [Catenovulum sediminis]